LLALESESVARVRALALTPDQCCSLARTHKAEAAKTATQLFKQYDTDNSGFIERKEWLQIWKALFSDGGTLSKAHLKLARIELERADTDGDGRVSFNEFIEWMRALGMYA